MKAIQYWCKLHKKKIPDKYSTEEYCLMCDQICACPDDMFIDDEEAS